MENQVESISVVLYPGEDLPIWYAPDLTDDVSGIDVDLWTVEVRLKIGRIPLGKVIVNPSKTISMPWNDPASQFEGQLDAADSYTMAPGDWTGEIWRTNNNAKKLLLRMNIKVDSTIVPTTTTSTTTTTTTTTP